MRWVFLLCCVLLWSASAAAAESVVRNVGFFPGGARFVFQIEAGKNGFDFTLPGAFDADSVRLLNSDGKTTLAVSSLRVENLPREKWTPHALSETKDRLDAKKRELGLYRARQNTLEQTLKMLDAPLPANFDGKNLILHIEDAHALRARLRTERVDLNAAIEKSGQELALLQAEYDRGIPANAENFIRVSGVPADASVKTFLAEALTHAAGWNVRYDMNLNSETGVIEVQTYARILQRTGLETTGEFTFHTRNPSQAVSLPRLGYRGVYLAEAGRPSPVMSKIHLDQSAPLNAALMLEDNPAFPREEFSPRPFEPIATLADITVKGSGSLKGDGVPQDIMLGRFTLSSIPLLVTIPEQGREVWIVASLDALPETLLPGTAKLTVDGMPTGETSISGFGKDQLSLPFGMAARISAAKTPLPGRKSSTWTGKGILQEGYTMEISNGTETTRIITVRDRLPLSTDDKVVLEVKRIDPQPDERDGQNRLTWKLSVDPGETKVITVEYALRYPGDERLAYEERQE